MPFLRPTLDLYWKLSTPEELKPQRTWSLYLEPQKPKNLKTHAKMVWRKKWIKSNPQRLKVRYIYSIRDHQAFFESKAGYSSLKFEYAWAKVYD